MKKRTMVKRVAAATMAGTMLMSMTAFAEFGNVTEGTYTKNLVTDGKTYAPATTFTFNVEAVEPTTGETWGTGNDKVAVSQDTNETLALSFSPVSFDGTEAITDNGIFVKATPTFTINDASLQKLDGGVYKYRITEDTATYEGVTSDTAVYYAYVYVLVDANNSRYVGAISFAKDTDKDGTVDTSDKVEAVVFENKYNYDGDPEDRVSTLTVKKDITGNQSVSTDTFHVSIKITDEDEDGEKYYVEKVTNKDQDNEQRVQLDDIVSGTAQTYEVTDNDYIVVHGLSKNDTYEVYETDANAGGYTTTYHSDEEMQNTITLTDDKVAASANNDNALIVIQNNKNAGAATGVAMTFAPYVLMLGAAGVAGGMFLRKKKEDF